MHPGFSSWFNPGALLKIPDESWFLIRGMGHLPGAKILYHPGRVFFSSEIWGERHLKVIFC
jgi:hypothetical protein